MKAAVFSAPKHGGTYSRLIVTLFGASGMINRMPPRAFHRVARRHLNFRKETFPWLNFAMQTEALLLRTSRPT
jgi:hypothetical protein